jgi:hypothetical protein
LIARHHSQASPCAQPWTPFWKPVVLTQLLFCVILIPSPVKLLMYTTFGGLEPPPQAALCSISGDLGDVPDYAGPGCLDELAKLQFTAQT